MFAVGGIAAGLVLGIAPMASATSVSVKSNTVVQPMNFTSNLSAVAKGFQSRRWSDVSYTQVEFTGCTDTGVNYDTGVDLRRDISLQPDDDYGTGQFTHCFGGSSYVSNGQWYGLASGTYFFQISYIDDNVNFDNWLTVKKVYQDTTAAD